MTTNMNNTGFVKYENSKNDEYIRLDTTIIGINNLIAKASTAEEANTLFKAKDVIYSQKRHFTYRQPVKHGQWVSQGADVSKAITREQYHDMTERFFDEFVDNGADEETVAKCMFIGLAFGKLELMLFGENEDGGSDDKP